MEKKLSSWVIVGLCVILANLIVTPFLALKNEEQPTSHGNSFDEIIIEEETNPEAPSTDETGSETEIYKMKTGKDIVSLALKSMENPLTISAKTTGTATTSTLGQTVVQDVVTYNKIDANGIAVFDTKSVKITKLGMSVWRKANYDGKVVQVSGSDYSTKSISKEDFINEYGSFIGGFQYVIDVDDDGLGFSKVQTATLGVFDEVSSSNMKVKAKFTTVTFSNSVMSGKTESALQKAVKQYAKYVNTMSGTKTYPSFNSLKLTFYVGTDEAGIYAGQIIKLKVSETYKLKVVAGETVTNEIQTNYQSFKNYYIL